ncbi:hypothetical protein ESA94_15810 [Lacibacter luteus]|uniref:Methylamine utilisation protein MauE domain-containing protein n=1 Tax=Lacibacter luteus TaxID=2508719 RepID=A0A4Q1CFR8_9BACT|nr:MauE/DoxX family redox-associated membrane protein [Lacibacter luteus]RXK58853.1 hypothetical protein ESA94_15810 [Lacibacter luteus]
MNPSVTIRVSCFLLIALFFYTGISKLFQHHVFLYSLNKAALLRHGAAGLSYVIPLTELLVALLLFFPRTQSFGLYSSLFLLTLFTVYLVAMLLFVNDLPCSCGGVLSMMSWQQHIWFNLFFIAWNSVGLHALRKTRQ